MKPLELIIITGSTHHTYFDFSCNYNRNTKWCRCHTHCCASICLPASSPYSCSISSEQPLITAVVLAKPGSTFTKPLITSQAVTLSRLPSSRFRLPSIDNVARRAQIDMLALLILRHRPFQKSQQKSQQLSHLDFEGRARKCMPYFHAI